MVDTTTLVTVGAAPRKGDTVVTSIRGQYSHQGALSAGFHIVTVAGGYNVALPPDTEFLVVHRWRPPEPPPGHVVHIVTCDRWYKCDPQPGTELVPWRPVSRGDGAPRTWAELLAWSNNGRDLAIYHPHTGG